VRAAISIVCLLGCDGVFDLENVTFVPTDAGPDAPDYPGQIINDPTGDFDMDGLANASDPCALIEQTAVGGRDDTDADGVGDLCDPNPQMAGDCMVLFDSFDAPSLSSHWKYDGQAITREAPGYLHIPSGPDTLVYLDQPLEIAALYIAGYVTIGANAPGTRFALETFSDVTRSPGATGTACSLESDKAASRVAIVEANNSADTLTATAPVGSLLVAAGSTAALRWRADGCYGELRNGVTESGTVPSPPPQSGVFGLRSLLVGFDLYVVVGYGRGC
jgi:hypothetical protein